MSYPAYDQFGHDIRVGFARWKVYIALQPPRLDFVTAREVKVWALSQEIVTVDDSGKERHMSQRKVRAALDWLIANGYLIEHERGTRRVRCVRLAFAVTPEHSDRPAA